MSHLKCPKCCGKSVPAGSIGCSYCNINSGTGSEMYGTSHTEQPEVAVPRETDEASVSRNYMLPNSMSLDLTVTKLPNSLPLDLTVTKQTREGNISNYQTVKKTDQELRADKQSRQEISKETVGKRDLVQETSAATNCMPSGNSHSVDIREVLPILDSQFNSQLKGSSYFEMSGGSRNHSAPNDTVIVSSFHPNNRKRSLPNDSKTSESNTDKKYKPEIRSNCGGDLSTDNQQCMNYDKTLGLNATIQIAVDNSALSSLDDQNIESNNNISETDDDYNAPSETQYSIASNRESVFAVCDSLAMPGPSGLAQSPKYSNLCEEAIRALTCMVCKVAISEHATEENNFNCCKCLHTDCEEVGLQIHSFTHILKTTCNICGKKYAAGNSHNNKHKCLDPDCKMTFYCRTVLYEHFLNCTEYFRKNCWVCGSEFMDHITENASYVCCVCGYESKQHTDIGKHNILHLPIFHRKLCKEEYPDAEESLHGSVFTCFDCSEIFKCLPQLEDHFENRHGCWNESCRICKKSKYEHIIGTKRNNEYQCCKCLQIFTGKTLFQHHLNSHTRLRDYKCEKCGSRFYSKVRLGAHLSNCKGLPFKCEICEIRFSSCDILREHFLLKHNRP